MEIYVTDLETGNRFRFPMLPESIRVQTGASFYNYSIINIGEVRLPSGEQLSGFSWSGRLPGKLRKDDPYLQEWSDPKAAQSLWSTWRVNKKKLRLLVTETPINHNVYLKSYSVEYSGGYGDYTYNISFVQAKDLKIYASGASGGGGGNASTAATVENKPQGTERPTPPPAGSYTVVKGDSMWAIAERLMGDGSKYPQLYEANKEMIDARNKGTGNSKYTIYPGQTFTIPDPAPSAPPKPAVTSAPKTSPSPQYGPRVGDMWNMTQ